MRLAVGTGESAAKAGPAGDIVGAGEAGIGEDQRPAIADEYGPAEPRSTAAANAAGAAKAAAGAAVGAIAVDATSATGAKATSPARITVDVSPIARTAAAAPAETSVAADQIRSPGIS